MAWQKSTRIVVMLVIDIAFFFLELVVGLLVGSLALMADAFHMLNDIISLLVGLWAVQVAQKESSDRFSFGWLRAEILGAFFNAVFLIALCVSIVLEAITRFFDPPEIPNPKLILIVGSLGLLSNALGFFVLGGHGHSHGPGGHDHDHDHGAHAHDDVHAAEEGHYHKSSSSESHPASSGSRSSRTNLGGRRSVSHDQDHDRDVGDLEHATSTPRYNTFTSIDEDAATQVDGSRLGQVESQTSSRHTRTRTNSTRNKFPDSMRPSERRQYIIDRARYQDDSGSSDSDDAAVADACANADGKTMTRDPASEPYDEEDASHEATEETGLLTRAKRSTSHAHDHRHSRDATHQNHNHNKPRKASKGHSHNHADMGMHAMLLHVMGDALGNVGVIVSALVIWLTTSPYRFYADPAVSLFITIIILHSTIPLTKASAKILLQATPDHLDVNDIKDDIQSIDGVVSCHQVHIWQLSDSEIVASLHIQVSFPICVEGGRERYMVLAKTIRSCLHGYGIQRATIQPEFCTIVSHSHDVPDSPPNFDGPCSDASQCLMEAAGKKTKGCCPTNATNGAAADEHDDNHGHDHGSLAH